MSIVNVPNTIVNGEVANDADVNQIILLLNAENGIIALLNAIADNETGKLIPGAFTENIIIEDMVDILNAAIDGYVLSWNEAERRFEWKEPLGGADTFKIKATSLDPAPDYIDNKLESGGNLEVSGNKLKVKDSPEFASIKAGLTDITSTVAGVLKAAGKKLLTEDDALKYADKSSGLVQGFNGELQVKGDTVLHQGNITSITSKNLVTDVEVTVGTGGDFPTINAAIEELSRAYSPVYLAGGNVKATIRLKAGFVMAEQVVVENIDLSWITIIGDDAETVIARDALTTLTALGSYAAFTGLNCKFPLLWQLFSMNVTGDAPSRHGIAARGSLVNVGYGCGVKNAAGSGLLLFRGCICQAASAVFTGCDIGAYVNNSMASIANVNVSNSGTGIYALYASNVHALNGIADNCAKYGAYAHGSSKLHFEGGHATGCNSYAVYARAGSKINAQSTNCTTLVASYEYAVADGSEIVTTGYTGSGRATVTVNTVTSSGIIFN